MSKYNDDYFFILKKQDDGIPYLVPDKNTENRDYGYRQQPLGSPPLVFHNGWKEQNKKNKIDGLTPHVLFCGRDLVVKKAIYDVLVGIEIPDLHLHPAIYIDNKEKWHEDYWYMTFTKKFDCWDRAESEFNRDSQPIEVMGIEYYNVNNFSLDSKAIETRNLEQRLLFQMGATLQAHVTCHKSLVSVLSSGADGVDITPITEY